MRRKSIALIAVVAVLGLLGTSAAFAETSTVTATVGSTTAISGTRSITSVTPLVTMASIAGTASLNGTVVIVVDEVLRTGQNWSITAAMSDLSTATTPANTIGKANMTITPDSVTVLLGSGALSVTKGAAAALDVTRTVFSVAQDPLVNYIGTYTNSSTLKLSVPNGTKTGVYTGTLTVTLVQ